MADELNTLNQIEIGGETYKAWTTKEDLPTDYAQQGSDSTATNTAIKALLVVVQGLIGQSIDDRTAATLFGKLAAIIEAISGIHIDIPDNIATKDDVTAAKQAILDALSHISPEDPNSKALAEFFGVTVLQGYEFMTDTEVTDELEDIMQAIDPELTAEQAASITAEAMEIINPSQS